MKYLGHETIDLRDSCPRQFNIFGIQFHANTGPTVLFGDCHCGASAKEGVEHRVPRLTARKNTHAHELWRERRKMCAFV